MRSPSGTASGKTRGRAPVDTRVRSATSSSVEPSALSTSTRSPGASRPVPAKTWTPAFSSEPATSRDCASASALTREFTRTRSTPTSASSSTTPSSADSAASVITSAGDERLARHTVGEDRGSAQPVPVDDGDLGAQLCRDSAAS